MSDWSIPSPSEPPTPSLHQRISDWWNFSEKKRTTGFLGIATLSLLGLCLWMSTRPPETIEKQISVPVKAQLIAVQVQKGEDLGTIGARFGRSRIETVGFNLELIEKNTVRCGEKTAGVCRRDRFGERDLAFDAIWPGDTVLVVPQDALDIPSALASIENAQ